MKKWFQKNKYTIWYSLCFLFLGLIDQRRGSAKGDVQMAFANLTGVVVTCMLLPAMKKAFFRWKGFAVWAAAAVVLTPVACVVGDNYWSYNGQWYTAMIDAALLSGLILYVIWNRKAIKEEKRLNGLCFGTVLAMLLLMSLSVHDSLWPLWFLGLFGCFYLIGIPKELEKHFFLGMLYGLILWFFIQQIIAFGFRPYDYVRYRGLYSGETQNGLFYMIIFCAFLCLWLYKKEKKAAWWSRLLCFLLAAGCVSFMLLTGGRAPLVGAVAAGAVGLMGYDIFSRKRFRHWLAQGVALGLCVLLLFPVVYGCVRYLPTILHHPVWFEGEYNADTSVHSYDPWNSERYITFEKAVDFNIGRILQMLGIDFQITEGTVKIDTPLTMKVLAAEPGEPGSSPDNPFALPGIDFSSSISVRKTIYAYYFSHLNLMGHVSGDSTFYIRNNLTFGHAHNMFLQVAFDYGIPAGIIFLLWNALCLVRLLCRKNLQGLTAAVFVTAILLFGFSEMAVVPGQITLVLLFLLYYWGMQKRLTDKGKRQGLFDKAKQKDCLTGKPGGMEKMADNVCMDINVLDACSLGIIVIKYCNWVS